jgi:hypothetical protein
MNIRRTSVRLSMIAAGAIAVATLSGCAGLPGASKATSESNAALPSSAGSGQPAKGTCSATDFKADIQMQPPNQFVSPGMALLALTNTSTHPCTIKGWADVTPGNLTGNSATGPEQKVTQPGPAQPITLQPGNTAFAGVRFVDDPAQKDNEFKTTEFDVTPPGAKSSISATVRGTDGQNLDPSSSGGEIHLTSTQIGTLQSSPQGVVAW